MGEITEITEIIYVKILDKLTIFEENYTNLK